MLSNLGLWALATSILIPTSQCVSHQVYAGDHNAGGDTRFYPQNIKADANDTIMFIFLDRHTVTQTSFGSPCANRTALSSFDSGFLGPGQNFTVTVMSSDPVWIRCSGNCAGGMVAAINAPSSGEHSFTKFQENALGRVNGTYTTTTTTKASSSPTTTTTTTTRNAAKSRYVSTGHLSHVWYLHSRSGCFIVINFWTLLRLPSIFAPLGCLYLVESSIGSIEDRLACGEAWLCF